MRSNSRSDDRERTFIEAARRDQIIAAANETVAAVGYAKASLARIAEQAQISKSVISYHFSGKDEVFEEAVTRFFDEGWQYMRSHIEGATSSADAVRAWTTTQLTFFAQHRTRFLAMVEIVSNHRKPDGSHTFAAQEAEEIEALSALIRTGQADGEFRDIDPQAAATIISHLIEGALTRWAYDPTIDLTAQVPTLVDFIDHALRRPTS